MKKVYEAPSVKITVFTASEDILVGSDVIIDTGDLFGTVYFRTVFRSRQFLTATAILDDGCFSFFQPQTENRRIK